MKKRDKYIAVVIAVIAVSMLAIIYNYASDGEKRLLENMTSDKSIEGTAISKGVSEVSDKVSEGSRTYPISTVMKDKDGYACAIRTSFGPMSLKVKDGKIREDIVWSDSNTTAFIIGNYVYRYSSEYVKWLRFNYSSGMELSKKQMTSGIFSESELLNKTKPEEVACVKAKISDDDFVFPMNESFDVTTGLSGLGLTT